MTNRSIISPDKVRISLPGVNVLNPPSLTPRHLAIDSSWTNVEQIHEVFRTGLTNLAIVQTCLYSAIPGGREALAYMYRSGPREGSGSAQTVDAYDYLCNYFAQTSQVTVVAQRHFILSTTSTTAKIGQDPALTPKITTRYNFTLMVFKP